MTTNGTIISPSPPTPESGSTTALRSNHPRRRNNPYSIPEDCYPPFPEPGSILARRYFVLSRLGRGTFCSIHKCVDLSRDLGLSGDTRTNPNSNSSRNPLLVAAKVELSTFTNSGVLEGEAMVLKHLDQSMPPDSVPIFLEYLRNEPTMLNHQALGGGEGGLGLTQSSISAIIMEYLPGEDMAHLRERYCAANNLNHQQQQQQQQHPNRRIHIKDAVYLVADVMLPLLQRMHETGVIHRDVKPSNCVRVGTSGSNQEFKIVDFGLSKSFVVPKESALADLNLPWNGTWNVAPTAVSGGRSSNNNEEKEMPKACQRQERPAADFRGTSMYASLRVHQNKDYARRDDIWGLLYVFCDLVSGGLPWMVAAANRDREMCGRMKQDIHGEGNARVEEVLYGAAYHNYRVRYNPQQSSGEATGGDANKEALKLKMASDQTKVLALREAFEHLGGLSFGDEPDYYLIGRCLRAFLPDDDDMEMNDEDDVPRLDWYLPPDKTIKDRSPIIKREITNDNNNPHYQTTPLPENLQDEEPTLLHQLRLAKTEYNAAHSSQITNNFKIKPTVLQDWLAAAIPLVYEPWNSAKSEKWGAHRSESEGYRREAYCKAIQRCLNAATPFQNFMHPHYFQIPEQQPTITTKTKTHQIREKTCHLFMTLRATLEMEEKKGFAPPPAISFNQDPS